jgi:5-hydroxyisourate hydrolase
MAGGQLIMGISTHILDTAQGRPAEKVPIVFSRLVDGEWILINEVATDSDGRCKNLLPQSLQMEPGIYRIHFKTAVYYSLQKVQGLYPFVEVVFEVANSEQQYHIPLLLTANGYTTYRGS